MIIFILFFIFEWIIGHKSLVNLVKIVTRVMSVHLIMIYLMIEMVLMLLGGIKIKIGREKIIEVVKEELLEEVDIMVEGLK